MKLAISEYDCNLCAECLDICTQGAVNLAEGNIDMNLCIECGACVEGCPNGAIFDTEQGYY